MKHTQIMLTLCLNLSMAFCCTWSKILTLCRAHREGLRMRVPPAGVHSPFSPAPASLHRCVVSTFGSQPTPALGSLCGEALSSWFTWLAPHPSRLSLHMTPWGPPLHLPTPSVSRWGATKLHGPNPTAAWFRKWSLLEHSQTCSFTCVAALAL